MNYHNISDLSTYLLPSGAALAVFYLLYKGLVRNDGHLNSRRFLILGFLIFAMVLPFLHFEIPKNVDTSGVSTIYKTVFLHSEIAEIGTTTPNITPANDAAWTTHAVSLRNQLVNILGWIYLIGVLILVGRGIFGIRRLTQLSRNGKSIQINGSTVILDSNQSAAFSFFNRIFIPKTWYNGEERDFVLRHEQVHVKQKHSWDLMLMELVCVMQFFNPFAWLLKREMRLNHEYLADRGALENGGDKHLYFQLLTQKTIGKQPILVHSFNYSSLKHRIMMQISKPANLLSQARYLAFVPLALALTFLFACQAKSTSSENSKYIFLNAEQLKALGIKLSDTDFFYHNYNENYKNDGEKYPYFATYTTGTGVSNMHAYDIPAQDELGHEMLKTMKVTHHDFYPKLVGNTQGHYYFFQKNGDKKFVPIAFCVPNRTDTLVIWFNPTESLQKALPKNVVMEDYVKIPDSRIPDSLYRLYYEKSGETEKQQEPSKLSKEDLENQIFDVVETNPSYPEGEEARYKYLAENIKYPQEAREKNIMGTVYARFVIERDGRISDVEIVRGIGGGCDEEVVRILKNMPKWTPGKQSGQTVRTRFMMPVKFTLSEDGKKS